MNAAVASNQGGGSQTNTVAIAEQHEPQVALRQMTDGHNVIEDYSHTGLTLRKHPVAFLRKDLTERNIITCAEAMNARDGRWVYTAGLVLVRQKPGSAKGVMYPLESGGAVRLLID